MVEGGSRGRLAWAAARAALVLFALVKYFAPWHLVVDRVNPFVATTCALTPLCAGHDGAEPPLSCTGYSHAGGSVWPATALALALVCSLACARGRAGYAWVGLAAAAWAAGLYFHHTFFGHLLDGRVIPLPARRHYHVAVWVLGGSFVGALLAQLVPKILERARARAR